MRIKLKLTVGLGLMMTALPVMAMDTKVYPYHAENLCPAGLQPVTITGVISCGFPNQSIDYQQAKMTTSHRIIRRARARRVACQEGAKGCS